MEGKICDQAISILSEPRSNYSHINPKLVDKCWLNKQAHADSWLLQSATGTKKRVHHWVRYCAFKMNDMPISAHLNVLPLGSYNMLSGMDWLYVHGTKVDCNDKAIEFLDDDGETNLTRM